MKQVSVLQEIFLLICISLSFIACERTVEIDVPYDGDKLVINSFIQPDSVVYIRVTSSAKGGAQDFIEPQGVQVNLMAGDHPMVLHYRVISGKGYYVSTEKAQREEAYSITASATGFDPVDAYDTIPFPPQILSFTANKGSIRAAFAMKDDPANKDFYRFRIYKADTLNGKVVPYERLKFRFDPSYSNVFTDIMIDSYYESALIKDDRFNGKEISAVIQFENPVADTGYLVLEITSLSDAAFQYLKTLDIQNLNNGNVLTEPSKVYSNVNNGYGIVGGLNASFSSVEL